MQHRTTIRLSSDKHCRVACHKDDVRNGRCHCANRIEDETAPPVLKHSIKSITDMEKNILVSDEVNGIKITQQQWSLRRHEETCEYPYVILPNRERFYFNRFLFL